MAPSAVKTQSYPLCWMIAPECWICKKHPGDGTTAALNARAHLTVILYDADREADARVEMDAMVAGVTDAVRPTALTALL
eukprot:COSAG03_NODE_11988_length_567_cov_0.747863_1_plen_79_part_10